MEKKQNKIKFWLLLCICISVLASTGYACDKYFIKASKRSASYSKKGETSESLTCSDAERIKKEYESYNEITRSDGVKLWSVSIPDDNPFKYVTIEEACKLSKEGTGVLFIGSPWCRICRMDVILLLDALNDDRAKANDYVKNIYYIDPDSVDQNDPAYPEFCNLVLSKMKNYICAADESYTNVYGTPKFIDQKKNITEETMNDIKQYKFTISYWDGGKLLGVNVGTTPHYINSDMEPGADDKIEFRKRFWEIAMLFGTDLCDYC